MKFSNISACNTHNYEVTVVLYIGEIVSVILPNKILNFWKKKCDTSKVKENNSLGALVCKQEIRKILHEKESKYFCSYKAGGIRWPEIKPFKDVFVSIQNFLHKNWICFKTL